MTIMPGDHCCKTGCQARALDGKWLCHQTTSLTVFDVQPYANTDGAALCLLKSSIVELIKKEIATNIKPNDFQFLI
jgi:hypothetical protein